MSLKSYLKLLIPPILGILYRKVVNKNYNLFKGNYENWKAAELDSIGYHASTILNNCREATLKVKKNRAIFERDSFILTHPEYAWPTIACLQNIALEHNNNLNLIDFGGALGSSYFQNRIFLRNFHKVSWTVVEQPHFVACGEEYFKNDQLNFNYTIEEAKKRQKADCILLSGVLQCLEEPYKFLNNLIELKFKYIIIDRTSFIDAKQRLTVLNLSKEIYDGSYPLWFFNEEDFLSIFENSYQLISDFSSTADRDFLNEELIKMYWKGYFFKIKSLN